METIVMERGFEPAISAGDLLRMMADLDDCVTIHRAHWQESFLALDGSAITCCFRAPDAESIRAMTHGDGACRKLVWPGTLHATDRDGLANVMVERRFDTPVTVAALQAIEDAAAWCLQQHDVTFLRTYFSADQRTMLCLYRAPDAESVRIAQRQAKMPFERIWACHNFTPDNLPDAA